MFVRKLRQKLRAISPSWSYIHTHFGVGYRFAPEPEVGQIDGGNQTLLPAPELPGALQPLI